MKKIILLVIMVFLTIGCASNPYVIKTTYNQDGSRIDTICTHKKMFIPWYAVVAAGYVTFNYDEECHDEVVRTQEN